MLFQRQRQDHLPVIAGMASHHRQPRGRRDGVRHRGQPKRPHQCQELRKPCAQLEGPWLHHTLHDRHSLGRIPGLFHRQMGRQMASGRGPGDPERRHHLARSHGALHSAVHEFPELHEGAPRQAGHRRRCRGHLHGGAGVLGPFRLQRRVQARMEGILRHRLAAAA